MISQAATDDFVEAWHDSEGTSFSQRMARKSLVALAHREPDLEPLLSELKGGSQQHLDLRLTGKDVDSHWAPADIVGDIFKDFAEAVKELAKSIAGKQRWKSGLMTKAPAAGSLSLSFATAATARQLTLDDSNLGSPDDQALVQLGQLFAAAAHGSDSLPGAARHMHNDAAIPVRRVATALIDQGWKVDFTAYGPFYESVCFQLDRSGSESLLEWLNVEQKVVTSTTMRGILDGWRWSEGSLYFIPDHGMKFSAAVPVSLQHDVAKLASNEALQIEARFNRVEINNIHQKRAKRTSYELVSINEVPPHALPAVTISAPDRLD